MCRRSIITRHLLLPYFIISSIFTVAYTLPLSSSIRRNLGPRSSMYATAPSKGVQALGSESHFKASEGFEPNRPASNVGIASISTRLLLFTVPVVWGTYTCAVKFLYQSAAQPPPTVLFNFFSYLVALTTLLSIQCVQRVFSSPSNVNSINTDATTKQERVNTWFAGAELGFYLFLGSNLQVAGIQRTSAASAAALVQLSAVIVPLMEAVAYRRMPSRRLWLASMFSVAGMSTFSGVFSPPVGVASMYGGNANILGNILMLGAASCYSLHILRLSALASRVGQSTGSVLRLAVAKSTTEVILAAGAVITCLLRQEENLCSWMTTYFGIITQSAGMHGGIASLALSSLALVVLWNGAVVTAFPMWAQAFGQQRVGASEAAIIYATQPVWAVAFAAVFLNEMPLGREMIGGTLLLAAILLSITPHGVKDTAENGSR